MLWRCREAASPNDPCPLRVAEPGVARRGRSAGMPSERDQAKDGLFARAPSTSSDSGTCRGAAAAGHPAGTMALVTLAETKVTRASRAASSGSAFCQEARNLQRDGAYSIPRAEPRLRLLQPEHEERVTGTSLISIGIPEGVVARVHHQTVAGDHWTSAVDFAAIA